MARKKSNLLEDLFEITAALPWWVGVVLSVTAYVVLPHYANAEITIIATPGQAGQFIVAQLVKTFAFYGQYLFPPLFLVAAVTSFFKRRKRQKLALMNQNIESIRGLSWREFELLVGEVFRMQGYSVAETGGGGADGGIDLRLRKSGELFLVQCKQWQAYKVSVNIVRELYGVMAAQGAAGGFVVTSGVFTRDAQAFAEGKNIELLDGVQLVKLLAPVKTTTVSPMQDESSSEETSDELDVICPSCGSAMVKRVAGKGVNKGKAFWGCSQFPRCRSTMS